MSYVYFISDGEHVKIGLSKDPVRRMARLQTASPRPLQLLLVLKGDVGLEQQLHARFAQLRLSGEWFRNDGALMDYIRKSPPAVMEEPKGPRWTVEDLVDYFKGSGLPIKSLHTICNLHGAFLSGEYDDPADPEGAIYSEWPLAAPIGNRSMTYLLIGLGGLPADFADGLHAVEMGKQK